MCVCVCLCVCVSVSVCDAWDAWGGYYVLIACARFYVPWEDVNVDNNRL